MKPRYHFAKPAAAKGIATTLAHLGSVAAKSTKPRWMSEGKNPSLAAWMSHDASWRKPTHIPSVYDRPPVDLSSVRPKYNLNPQPFGLKMATHSMNHSAHLFIASSINEKMTKQAGPGLLGTLAGALGKGKGLLSGAAEKLEGVLPNNGLTQGIGKRVGNVFGKMDDRIAGAAPGAADGIRKVRDTAYGLVHGKSPMTLPDSAMELSDDVRSQMYNGLRGRRALSRGIVGGGALGAAGTGTALALEAPGKLNNNAKYEQQQVNPIRSWLAQHLMGAPKLQRKSLLNPFNP